MLGGLVSWVTTGLLGSMGLLAPRGTVHQERSTTDGCSTATAEAAAQTLRLCALMVAWAPALSMDALAPRVACGDVGVSGHVEASRTRPAVSHAVAVSGEGRLEPCRHGPEADVSPRTHDVCGRNEACALHESPA